MKTNLLRVMWTVLLCCWVCIPGYAAPMDPVSFRLVDLDHDNAVEINLTSTWPLSLDLDWSYDGSNWNDWDELDLVFNESDVGYSGMLFLSIFYNDTHDTSGEVSFGGSINGGINDLYRSVAVQWNENPSLSFMTVEDEDAISPTVPITSAAVLFGSGILGLVAIGARRKIR